jgi:hypothetical protein
MEATFDNVLLIIDAIMETIVTAYVVALIAIIATIITLF